MAVFKTTTDVVPAIYKEGERFCQLVIVPIPDIDVVEVEELSATDRQEDGFGSTGEGQSAPTQPEGSHEVETAVINPEVAEEGSGETVDGLEQAE